MKNVDLEPLRQSIGHVKELFSKSFADETAPRGSLGVDIGTHSIKIIRLESSRDSFKVLGFAVEKVMEKNYRDALSKALVKAKVSAGENAVTSVSGQGVVSRYIELPQLNRSELESSMKFEIEKYVPFPMAEVVSDYTIVHEMKDRVKLLILIAAAKTDLIQKKCNLAREINLNLKAIDLDCLALANFIIEIAPVQKKGTCLGIVNIGKSVSSINILADGVPYLSRDIFVGGDDITKKMSEVLEVDYDEAEKLKNDPAARQKELFSIWDPILNNLAAEIRVSLDYFEARNNKAVEKIFITGGSSRLMGIEEYLNHALGIEIKKLDCCGQLKFDETVNQGEFKKNGDLLVIALGLALR